MLMTLMKLMKIMKLTTLMKLRKFLALTALTALIALMALTELLHFSCSQKIARMGCKNRQEAPREIYTPRKPKTMVPRIECVKV